MLLPELVQLVQKDVLLAEALLSVLVVLQATIYLEVPVV